MSSAVTNHLLKRLAGAHAMEAQGIKLLEAAARVAGDEEIAVIYRVHLLQTKEHERLVAGRLEAYGRHPSRVQDAAMQAAAVGVAAATLALDDTPIRLAETAFTFEHHEIAIYRVLGGLAGRAGDEKTRTMAERILEQEAAAAELVAGTFERALDITLGESAPSPLTVRRLTETRNVRP